MTGFEIRAFIDQSVQFFWRESYGQIYPELKRLHEEGLIKPASSRGRKREAQPWRITAAGQAALREWLDRPAQMQALRDETLLKLFFSRHASEGSAQNLVDAARAGAEARLAALEAAERAVIADAGDPDLLNSLTVIARGQMAARMTLAWCARADALREAWESGGAEALIRQWRRT
jgi:DNA-binding PadR family transcriptional regulator